MTDNHKQGLKRWAMNASIGLVGLAAGVFGFSPYGWPGSRLSALEVQFAAHRSAQEARNAAFDTRLVVVEGLARFSCIQDQIKAELAGLPCNALLGRTR